MALSLSKRGNLLMSKPDPGDKSILIGLGWDERAFSGNDFDLDASVFNPGPASESARLSYASM
ncbi:TerD family protein [Vreelandella aquamarina]